MIWERDCLITSIYEINKNGNCMKYPLDMFRYLDVMKSLASAFDQLEKLLNQEIKIIN